MALLVGLGLGTSCAGEDEPLEPVPCDAETSVSMPDGLWRCSSGVIHRRLQHDDAPCDDCVGPTLTDPRDECLSDADCPEGALCAETKDRISSTQMCSQWVTEVSAPYFACLTSRDACGADAQCVIGLCARDGDERKCFGNSSYPCGVPGRPFLVGAEIRRAALRVGAGWSDPSSGGVQGLDTSQRARLACHYEKAALLEHASIAAFARFTLQLLELGAPADLCSAAQEAMRDETLHARLCFSLASRYAGRELAPGPLPMTGVLAACTLDEVARLCLLEGCVGETLAALDAAEALASATDPEVRLALGRIADDERRHAELAFRFLAWALERSSTPGLRYALAAVLDATVAASRPAPEPDVDGKGQAEAAASNDNSGDDARLEAHGILCERRRSALRHAALEEVVVPCVRQLLAEAGVRRPQPSIQAAG
ncbi:MAG TPA: ferritin-like domain-containing protein [Polyangiaceae bacterium]|nr:ferritin-like domain-containing protein [Polyangiaceae bacterium]